ncbi:putative glutamate-1-semialdehyde 2,1-aminomutase [Usnea florida]
MSPTQVPSSESDHLELIRRSKDALVEAHSRYTRHNQISLKAHEAARRYQPGGNTRTSYCGEDPFPITFASGNGCTLTSLDDHVYIDFLGEYTAGIYGHNNAIIRTAIDEALTRGWSFGGNNMYEKELARIVCERFAPTMELVRFTNSGTEANMMAVATALAWTGRTKILVFRGGYHGATISFRHEARGLAAKSVNLPHEWVVGTYNDIDQTEEILSALPPKSLAAILVEPMLGNAGAVPGSLPFLQFLRSYASSNEALLIFDEVMTSRLSYRGLGHRLGIRPDLMTLGKWVGGGMSFGAFGGRSDVMEMYDPRKKGGLAHAGTFNNNVISMAAGCAGCRVLDEETTNRLNDLGERLKEKVMDVIEKHLYSDLPRTVNVEYPMYMSGIGSILAIHFPPSSPHLPSLFYHHMLSKGIYLAERGFIALNIELGMEEVDKFVDTTGKFVEKWRDILRTAA